MAKSQKTTQEHVQALYLYDLDALIAVQVFTIMSNYPASMTIQDAREKALKEFKDDLTVDKLCDAINNLPK